MKNIEEIEQIAYDFTDNEGDRKKLQDRILDLFTVSKRSEVLSCDGECDWQLRGIQSNDYLECSKCNKRKST